VIGIVPWGRETPGATGAGSAGPIERAGSQNMQQLIALRWLAVSGQLVTILVVDLLMDIPLPLVPMLTVTVLAAALNLASGPILRRMSVVTNVILLLTLLYDVGLLTVQLYLSGGATNPFVGLYLLHVVLGAVLLEAWSTWVIAVVTSLCFAVLAFVHRPLSLPQRFAFEAFDLYMAGVWACFVLIAVLLVLFISRITSNLRDSDHRVAALRQRAAEEDHIVRMGLLASGAAHELGTPLASLAVILSDWRRVPALAGDPQLSEEIAEMQAEVGRCKAIVTGILLSAGEARGEAPAVTTVRTFLDAMVADWRAAHPAAALIYDDRFGPDRPMISDPAMKQVIWNVLDNAVEASPQRVAFEALRSDDALALVVRDDGPGFVPAMLDNFGKPYQSSKPGSGHGLGLFLVVNVMRKLGGTVEAGNRPAGGAEVVLTLPFDAIGISENDDQ
jgi:two-component system sensor histidine kinase RegB